MKNPYPMVVPPSEVSLGMKVRVRLLGSCLVTVDDSPIFKKPTEICLAWCGSMNYTSWIIATERAGSIARNAWRKGWKNTRLKTIKIEKCRLSIHHSSVR